MNQQAMMRALEEANNRLPTAQEAREQTCAKVAQFAKAHQDRIVGKIQAAINLGHFKIDYEINTNASAEVMENLKSNLGSAGYTVQNGRGSHYPVWTISWSK